MKGSRWKKGGPGARHTGVTNAEGGPRVTRDGARRALVTWDIALVEAKGAVSRRVPYAVLRRTSSELALSKAEKVGWVIAKMFGVFTLRGSFSSNAGRSSELSPVTV